MWFRWGRRRRHEVGIFYYDTSRFRPSSWGVHIGRLTYNITRHVGSIRLPFGFGSESFGRGVQRVRRGRRQR
jgi:hypothetical protein